MVMVMAHTAPSDRRNTSVDVIQLDQMPLPAGASSRVGQAYAIPADTSSLDPHMVRAGLRRDAVRARSGSPMRMPKEICAWAAEAGARSIAEIATVWRIFLMTQP